MLQVSGASPLSQPAGSYPSEPAAACSCGVSSSQDALSLPRTAGSDAPLAVGVTALAAATTIAGAGAGAPVGGCAWAAAARWLSVDPTASSTSRERAGETSLSLDSTAIASACVSETMDESAMASVVLSSACLAASLARIWREGSNNQVCVCVTCLL